MNISSDQHGAIERARYKLRQAELLLCHLRMALKDIASDLRRSSHEITDRDVRLDAFFFSCLGLAKSAYNIIRSAHGPAVRSWLDVLSTKDRAQFEKTMKLRDIDVHQGKPIGKALATMIPIELHRDAWMQPQPQNYALLGITRPVSEHTNPDGSTVSSYDGLRSTMALHIEIEGVTWEASKACEQLITRLRQLIDAVSAPNSA
jgi:hypothetical protein